MASDLVGFFLSVVCGFVPMFFLAGVMFWLDRYEKEPKYLLGGVFGWGAVVAVIGALVLQIVLGQGVLLLTGSEALEEIAGSSLFAPVTEEILKGLAVLLVFLFFRHEFDSVLDGIVYAAVTALGFAATEDVLYYFSAYTEEGLAGLVYLVVLRFVIFGWQHAFFTSFTGIGLAVARLSPSLPVKIGAPVAGLSVAVFVHALHNSLLTFLNNMAGLVAAVLLAWTGWLVMLCFIAWLIYREKVWLTEYLRDEVVLATITPEQYRLACSPFGQSKARLAALGRGSYRSTVRFFQLCAELSHKKRQLATLGEESGNQRFVEAIRAELSKISPDVSL
jgi:RsiW-degrading membrane proteinase PrsW (M82 family)